jgi:thymidylate synthase (FAD)
VRVILVASTVFESDAAEQVGYNPQTVVDPPTTPADELAEFGGRLCYRSWDRPNPETASTTGYLANIINQRHFSVLEHASVTFYVGGVSRALTHELVRHRHFSFSQLSQRYVDHSEAEVAIPPVFNDLDFVERGDLVDELVRVNAAAQVAYDYIYARLRSLGFNRKEARGAARAVLPEATETEILVTGNLRAWREFLDKRLSPAADAEIRELAEKILWHLKDYSPATFQDFEEKT